MGDDDASPGERNASGAAPSPEGRPVWFDAFILGGCLFVVFVLSANYSGRQINDNLSAFTAAWTLGQHGTLDVSMSSQPKPWTVEVDGGLYSDRAPGIIAWAAPFYALLGNSRYLTSFPSGVASAASGAIAMGLLFALLRRVTGHRTALIGTLLASFGTATWTISADALWPHGPDQVWLVCMMLALSSSRWFVAGAASACALLTRPITVISAALAAVWLSWRDRSLRPLLVIGLVSAVGLAAFIAYNRLVFQAWTIAPGSYTELTGMFTGDSKTYDPTDLSVLSSNAAGLIVSPTRGVLVLSPFLLALLPGLRAGWRQSPEWVRASAVGGLVYAVVHVYGHNFSGGAGFYSYRYPIESLTLMCPLLVLSWVHWTSRRPMRRLAFAFLAVVAVTQHAAGALYTVPRVDANTYDLWRHFLFAEALRSGGLVRTSFVGACAAVALLTAAVALKAPSAATVEDSSPRARV